MCIFEPVLTGLSEISKKIQSNDSFLDENADFGHFGQFLACFWPVVALISEFKALNEYI